MLNILQTQNELLARALPPGFEEPLIGTLSALTEPFVDEIETDAIGNLICHKKGPGKRIMMSAHRDVIGFMATYIDPKGFVRFAQDGRHNPAFLQGIGIRFENGVHGTIQGGDQINPSAPATSVKLSDLYIDIGAKDYHEAASLIEPGSVAVLDADAVPVAGGNMLTPYADDLVGCIVLLIAMEELKEKKQCPNDLYFVFSVQEERGLIGARVAAQHLLPDVGIAVDVTTTGDTPRETVPMAVCLGKGPTIKIRDGFQVCSPEIVRHLRDAAREAGIHWQDEIMARGGTDSAAILNNRGGALAGTISIPTRGLHSQGEMVNLKDVEQAGKLLAAACLRKI